MRLAILADLHGNLPALEAVVAELERVQPDHVLVDGDLINAVPFSAEVIDCVRRRDWLVVRGNHEFYYLDFGTERAAVDSHDPARWGQLHWLVEHLSPEQGRYLGLLPDERTLYLPGTQPVRVAHGVPGRNRVGFYREQPAPAVLAEIQDIAQRTVVSAHTHVQIDRHLRVELDPPVDPFANPHVDGHTGRDRAAHRHWHLVNPGSVGLPLDGEPSAQFAVLESVPEAEVPGGWRATHLRVPYDRRPALAAFAESGMEEAGGVISRLFYWELVTAEPEIILFYRWARRHGHDPDADITAAFHAYQAGSARDGFVRQRDPLYGGG